MATTVHIYSMSGDVFEEIEYTTIDDLKEKLISLLVKYDADIHIQLLINGNDLNNFDIIDTVILSKIAEHGFITVILSYKKDLYCLGNENGKYILDDRNDNYSELLKLVILYKKNNSYNIIKKYSYKRLLLLEDDEIDERDGKSLEYASDILKNDKQFILKAVKQNGFYLYYTSNHLKNDKEIVLAAVIQIGAALIFASTLLHNNKEFILECVKQNSHVLQYIQDKPISKSNRNGGFGSTGVGA